MRVVDLDRDMSDVIPTGSTRDSQYLFERMTARTLELAEVRAGARILDLACGFGQDALALAARGARVVGAEPSARMAAWTRTLSAQAEAPRASFVRAWGHALPFPDGSFDAVLCKGALDHFDRPERAVAEMARVTRADGRVVLAIANFESLACRWARVLDDLREALPGRAPARGRRHYDVPADHFTRYEPALMREQTSRWLDLEHVEGISLLWGFPPWTSAVDRLAAEHAGQLLRGFDAVARRIPALADVLVLAGRPRPQPPTAGEASRSSR